MKEVGFAQKLMSCVRTYWSNRVVQRHPMARLRELAERESQTIRVQIEELATNPYARQRQGVLPSWRGVTTDPVKHNPAAFCYFVVAIRRNAEDPEQDYDRILSERYNSTSLIDQDHRATIASIGFILGVPPENIISAHPIDALSPMGDGRQDEWALESFLRTPLRGPEQLLLQTGTDQHNEILVFSVNPNSALLRISIRGVFIKLPPRGRRPAVLPETIEKWRKFAIRKSLPVVEISDPDESASSKLRAP